jgi:Leucine-rich repeat (LRR) protein
MGTLKSLNLSNNRLSGLPDMSALSQLEELDLGNNLLSYSDSASDSIIDKMKTIATGSRFL